MGSKQKCKAQLWKRLGFDYTVGMFDKTFDLVTPVSGGLVFSKVVQSTTLTQGLFVKSKPFFIFMVRI